jgi:hypothetical protein
MGSHNTAINRKSPSAPLKYILGNLSDSISSPVIDYGCGKGADAEHLFGINLDVDSYDPHWNPISLDGKDNSYNTIFCTYVLNVVEKDEEAVIISKIRSLLSDDGIAYITVRRDIKREGMTSRGLQRNVFLDLPIVKEYKNNFCIYKLTNYGGVLVSTG